MKLKYYLRGLGIGMIVTAVIMGVSVGGKTEPMTDAQVMERAKELGMVDGVLSQLPEQTEASEQTEVPQETEVPEQAEVPQEPENQKTEAEQPTEVKEPAETKAPEKQEAEKQPTVESSYIVTVYPGEGSYTVSRKLAALGLVESADIYDEYLCQNGYDKKICTGNHEIKAGMTAEQIAKALTTR